LTAATDATDEVGSSGIELGLHGLRRAVLRHDLESWRTGASAIGTRSPRESNKITTTRAAKAVRPVHPQIEHVPLALEAEAVTWPASVSVIDEMNCRTP
jgi:hypothetical protein